MTQKGKPLFHNLFLFDHFMFLLIWGGKDNKKNMANFLNETLSFE